MQVEVAVLGRTGVPPGLAARPLVAGELALAAPLRLRSGTPHLAPALVMTA